MAIREVLLLGDPFLYQVAAEVAEDERDRLEPEIRDLHDTLMGFRSRTGAGRAIAAPQIGLGKRLIYMNTGEPRVFFNPVLRPVGTETLVLWDDCLSFPDLLVRVQRHRTCRIRYRDQDWQEREIELTDDLAELLQHECDHLDGILATDRALPGRSLAWRGQARPGFSVE